MPITKYRIINSSGQYRTYGKAWSNFLDMAWATTSLRDARRLARVLSVGMGQTSVVVAGDDVDILYTYKMGSKILVH